MNRALKNVILKRDKKLNHDVMDGLSRKTIPSLPEYLHHIIRASVPTNYIEYLGYERLSPIEEFWTQFNNKGLKLIPPNKNKIDITDNTLYKVKYIFKYKDEIIERIIMLPYVRRGGILTLSGAQYYIAPVLTEYVISSSGNDVFARLIKDKVTYRRLDKGVIIDGNKEVVGITVTKPYRINKNTNKNVPISLLMLVKYGFYGIFKRYMNIDKEDIIILKDTDPTPEQKKDFMVFESMGRKPRRLKDNDYIPHNIKILVKRDKVTPTVKKIIASIITTFDYINVFSRNIISAIKDKDTENRFWKIILGKMIYNNKKYTLDKILYDMNEFMNNLDNYIDDITKQRLKEIGIKVDNYYDLLFWVIDNFEKMTLEGIDRSADISNRYIDINYYIAYDLIHGFNLAMYALIKEFNRKSNVTVKDINKIFDTHWSTRKIYSLVKGGTNIAMNPIDYSGDNYYFKITSSLVDQNQGQGVKKSKDNNFPKSTRRIHGEDPYIGSILYITKKAPSPRFKINPYAKINEEGKFVFDKKTKQAIKKLNKLFSQSFMDDDILSQEQLESFDL